MPVHEYNILTIALILVTLSMGLSLLVLGTIKLRTQRQRVYGDLETYLKAPNRPLSLYSASSITDARDNNTKSGVTEKRFTGLKEGENSGSTLVVPEIRLTFPPEEDEAGDSTTTDDFTCRRNTAGPRQGKQVIVQLRDGSGAAFVTPVHSAPASTTAMPS